MNIKRKINNDEKRILLCLPIWGLNSEWALLEGISNNRFHIGLASIASYLEERDFSVDIIDPQFYSEQEFKKFLNRRNYYLIGITTWTATISKSYYTAHIVKSTSPQSKVVLGGIHASNFPKRCLNECSDVDYVIRGEGERPMLRLCQELKRDESNRNLHDIPGLTFREGDVVVENKADTNLPPEEIPQIAYKKFLLNRYRTQFPLFYHLPTYFSMAGRGCPYMCSFCDAYTIHGKKVRIRPVEKILSEIIMLKEKFNARGLWFSDSTFTINKAWVYKFCDLLMKGKVNLPWGCFSRVDCVDEKLLRQMRKAGCWQIGYGFESGNQRTLDRANKRTSVEQNARAADFTEKAGISIYGSFIIGWPGEDMNDVWNTINFAKKLALPTASFHIPTPFPKTDLYYQAEEEGGLLDKNMSFEAYDGAGSIKLSVYVNPKIGREMMGQIVPLAYKAYYSSPKILLKHISAYHTADHMRSYVDKIKIYLRALRQ